MRIKPARSVKGSIRLPGDKSISHRAVMIAAHASGSSLISNFATSKDCASTLSCLQRLGVSLIQDGADVQVHGVGGQFATPGQDLDCGNSGSTMRMLAGLLAGQSFTSTLTGDESLRSRPMTRVVTPLELMGARVLTENGRPPLRIEGSPQLKAIRYELPVASAQVKSCVLLAGLLAHGRTEVGEIFSTRDHTERLLKWFAAPLHVAQDGDERVLSIDGPVQLEGRAVRIPGDFSSAAFLMTAAALLPASELHFEQVGLNATRTQFMTTLQALGAEIETEQWEDRNETVGNMIVRHTRSLAQESPSVVDGALTAGMIDELPLLAVVATQVAGGLSIRDARELRTKESDRIAATVKNLQLMGAHVEEHEDGLTVDGPARLRGAVLDSFGDHRIAMAFTVAALLAEGESEILGSDCVEISFPGFFEYLEAIVER